MNCEANNYYNNVNKLYSIIFLKNKLVSSSLRTVFCKTDLFSYAFRPTVADFFREFYKWEL